MPCRADGLGTGASPDGRYDDGNGSYDNNSNKKDMPCSDSIARDRIEHVDHTDYSKIDKLTQLLCEATKHLENYELMGNVSGELHRWHEQHKKEDRRRLKLKREKKEKETLKRKALNKLTSEEIKALGLA